MFPQVLDDGPGAERRKGHGENLGRWAMYIFTWNGCDLNKDNFAIIVWELYPSSDFLTLDSLFEGTALQPSSPSVSVCWGCHKKYHRVGGLIKRKSCSSTFRTFAASIEQNLTKVATMASPRSLQIRLRPTPHPTRSLTGEWACPFLGINVFYFGFDCSFHIMRHAKRKAMWSRNKRRLINRRRSRDGAKVGIRRQGL